MDGIDSARCKLLYTKSLRPKKATLRLHASSAEHKRSENAFSATTLVTTFINDHFRPGKTYGIGISFQCHCLLPRLSVNIDKHMLLARFALQIQNRQSFEPGINWIRNILWLLCLHNWFSYLVLCLLITSFASWCTLYTMHHIQKHWLKVVWLARLWSRRVRQWTELDLEIKILSTGNFNLRNCFNENIFL